MIDNIKLACLAGFSSALSIAAAIDFYCWLKLGTGGTPPTIRGYLKINKFRILRLLSNDDLKDASKLPRDGLSYIKGHLRQRSRTPPQMFGRTLPQRQYPEPIAEDIRERLHSLPEKYVKAYPELLRMDKSATEGGSTDAIYLKETTSNKTRPHDRVLGDEIAHVHPAENSLHVWLTPVDARKVVEAGWGERFPLSSLGMTDDGWTFIYAPQSMEDVNMIEVIIKAAIGCLSAVQID